MQNSSRAEELFSAREFQACLKYCKSVLETDPNHTASLKCAGKALMALGEPGEAQRFLLRAHQLGQEDPEVVKDIGNCLLSQGEHDRAANAYMKCLAIQSDYAPAIYNLGGIAQLRKDHKRAISLFAKAVELDSTLHQARIQAAKSAILAGDCDAAINLCTSALEINRAEKGANRIKGEAHRNKGELDKALEAFREEILISPADTSALTSAADILARTQRVDEAILLLQRSLEIEPNDYIALSNLSGVLNDVERHSEASHYSRRAIDINANCIAAHANLGLSQLGLGLLNEALSSAEMAISLDPSNAACYILRGSIKVAQARHEAAEEDYLKAIELDPLNSDAYTGLGCLQLTLGDYDNGWKNYSYRVHKKHVPGKKEWDGSTRESVVVLGEQGIGDQILYASLIRDLQADCPDLTLRIDERLVPLFRRSFSNCSDIGTFEKLNRPADEPLYRSYVSIGELGSIYRRQASDFEQVRQPYLVADSDRSQRLLSKLKRGSTTRIVGLSWRSEGLGYKNKCKCIELDQIAIALQKINGKYISLQYGNSRNDIEYLRSRHNIQISSEDDIDLDQDIDGQAALISACDTVVTISNVVAHLAGALGKETHLLVPRSPHYYWGLDSNHTPWYPSIRLYRQTTDGDWSRALEDIAKSIEMHTM